MKNTKDKNLLCCLCGDEITPENSSWEFGNNPKPLWKDVNDRCCDGCNEEFVIPFRYQCIQHGVDLTVHLDPSNNPLQASAWKDLLN